MAQDLDEKLHEYFSDLLKATVEKRNKSAEGALYPFLCRSLDERAATIDNEYEELEEVPPAPGQTEDQHDAMVKNGKSTYY